MSQQPGWKRIVTALALAVAVVTLFAAGAVHAQALTPDRGFYDLRELIRLIEIARESGFSEEEVRAITIEDRGKVINAWDYLQRIQAERAAEAKKIRDRESRVYLTVEDIVQELVTMEPEDLRAIRERLIFKK